MLIQTNAIMMKKKTKILTSEAVITASTFVLDLSSMTQALFEIRMVTSLIGSTAFISIKTNKISSGILRKLRR